MYHHLGKNAEQQEAIYQENLLKESKAKMVHAFHPCSKYATKSKVMKQ